MVGVVEERWGRLELIGAWVRENKFAKSRN
jgi:hypothetical protein